MPCRLPFPGRLFLAAFLGALLLAASGARAWAEADISAPVDEEKEEGFGLVPFARGAYLKQLAAEIDGGGTFSVDRAAVQTGPAYGPGVGCLIGLAFGYRYDGYDFRGPGVFGRQPWRHIHTPEISLVSSWKFNDRWSAIGTFFARWSFELGADAGSSFTYGGLGGVWYRVGERLQIGPGLGVQTQLEAGLSVFPILLVKWDIRPNLTLETGTGLGATLGPGLVLRWKPTEHWDLSFGGRYDRLRFRLDDDGVAPGGIGEDTQLGLLGAVTYRFGPKNLISVTLAAGVDLFGDLGIQDAQGGRIALQGHNPPVNLGVAFGVGF